MKPIIIGIASVPERVDCLKDTINSLYHQCDKIIIGLNNYETIPSFLNKPKIEIYLLDNSLGDAAKFYKIENYDDVYYLSCDDDLIYPIDYVSYMVSKCEKYGKPVGLHGAIINHPINSLYRNRTVYHYKNNIDYDVMVDYIGTGVLCFDTSKLKIKLSDFKYPNMADIWFGDVMYKNNIKPIVVSHKSNYLIYNQKMVTYKLDTIFDEYTRTKNDKIQTEIVKTWKKK